MTPSCTAGRCGRARRGRPETCTLRRRKNQLHAQLVSGPREHLSRAARLTVVAERGRLAPLPELPSPQTRGCGPKNLRVGPRWIARWL
jgi:hypothetical protein